MNQRGMWAGAGNALSDLGKMGLSEEIGKRKEARLQKLQVDSELRAEERLLASEGRAEGRALAAEGRAGERAERDRAAQAAAERARDERAHKSRLAEIEAQGKVQRANKEHEHELGGKGGPKYKLATTEGSSFEPGQTYIYNEGNPQDIFVVDPKGQKLMPVGRGERALPAIPPEVEAAARKAAEQQVSQLTSVLKRDSETLAQYGGDKNTAIDILSKQMVPTFLKAMNYNPADYGYEDAPAAGGLVSQSQRPPSIRKDKSAPVVLPPAGNAGARPPSVDSGASGGLPPAAAQRLREGQQTRFANGQVWTLKGGVPTRVE